MSILGTHVHRRIGLIDFLVAGLCALPSNHGVALRCEERSRAFRETETSGLGHHAHTARLAGLGQEITESDVLVLDHELHVHPLLLRVGKPHGECVRLFVHPACLATTQVITDVTRSRAVRHPSQSPAEITEISHQPERRLLHERHFAVLSTVIRHIIAGFIVSTAILQSHFQERLPVGTGYDLLRCLPGSKGRHHRGRNQSRPKTFLHESVIYII